MGLILVDSSVWIDFFNDRSTPQTLFLEAALTSGQIVGIGDLVLTEVLQGTRSERSFAYTLARLSMFDLISITNRAVATAAAHHYRTLRSHGITIRKTIDTLIATRCIMDRLPLLYADRDFDPFVCHLGLIPALGATPGVS